MIVQTIRPGARVRVVLPEGERDPWLKPKAGWEGIVLSLPRGMSLRTSGGSFSSRPTALWPFRASCRRMP